VNEGSSARPRSEGGQDVSVPVESTAASRGATLPATARPPKYPEAHSHKYVTSDFCLCFVRIYAVIIFHTEMKLSHASLSAVCMKVTMVVNLIVLVDCYYISKKSAVTI